MLKWLSPLRGGTLGVDPAHITDDPLAALDVTPRSRRSSHNIYAVSRSVILPRVTITAPGLNPLFLNEDHAPFKPVPYSKPTTPPQTNARESESPPSAGKSSGYASHPHSRSESSHSEEPIYIDKLNPKNNETQGNFRIYRKSADSRNKKVQYSSHPSPSSSSSSIGCHLTTIPEGKVDFIPRPVWPNNSMIESKHELEDPSQQIYESLTSYITQLKQDDRFRANSNSRKNIIDSKKRRACAEDLLRELSKTIEDVVNGKIQITPEELLQGFNTKISQTLNVLQLNTENEIRNLSNNISSGEKLQVVARALSNNSIGTSSRNSSPSTSHDADDEEDCWPQNIQTTPLNATVEEFYEIPSANSSSGYSDVSPAVKHNRTIKPSDSIHFVHRDLGSVSNGVRNAMIYGTLCRTPQNPQSVRVTNFNSKYVSKNVNFSEVQGVVNVKNRLALHNDKPSVWENYYGAGITTGEFKLFARPTDTPTFPAGRPEADFTLDVPRAEFLMRRMKADKRWRCKCRIITSLLGLIFFLFTVMAVSLMLTNGKKMFGSMF